MEELKRLQQNPTELELYAKHVDLVKNSTSNDVIELLHTYDRLTGQIDTRAKLFPNIEVPRTDVHT